MAKIQLPVRVEDEVWETIKSFAKEENRTPSNYVDTMFKNHIALKKQKSEGKK